MTQRSHTAFRLTLTGLIAAMTGLGTCLTGCDSASNSAIAAQTANEGFTADANAPQPSTSSSLDSGTERTEVSATVAPPTVTDVIETAAVTADDASQLDASQLDAGNSESTSAPEAVLSTLDAVDTTASEPPLVGTCDSPIPLTCGDRFQHDTRLNGRPNEWGFYLCTARAESGREAIYNVRGAANCDVEVRLSNLTVDLDLFFLAGCDYLGNLECSSTPIDLQDVERVSFKGNASGTDNIVVDGYAGEAGSYTLEVDCTCDASSDAGAN